MSSRSSAHCSRSTPPSLVLTRAGEALALVQLRQSTRVARQLARAKPAPNVDWATYYGGENPDSWDWIEAIAAAPDGGVLVAGSGGRRLSSPRPGA